MIEMRLIKILILIYFTAILNSCDSDGLRDTSFADFSKAPTNVGVMTKVSTDFSGSVQIIPYADGAEFFLVDLGDGSAIQEISTGNEINHIYETGQYEIKVVAFSTNDIESALQYLHDYFDSLGLLIALYLSKIRYREQTHHLGACLARKPLL